MQETTEDLKYLAQRLELADINQALHFPKYFQIETTRLCNSRCRFCVRKQLSMQKPFIDDALFKKLADEIGEYADWIVQVCVQRVGEPLMDKKLVSRIAYLKKLGIKRVNLSTNISLLTEEKAKEILGAGIDEVMFSLDSLDKKTYEARRIGLSFDTVLANALRFLELRDIYRPSATVRFKMAIGKDNQHEVKDYLKFWKSKIKKIDRVYAKPLHNWGNQLEDDLIMKVEDLRYNPCVTQWSSMNILTNGDVALCPVDYDAKQKMGSVVKKSIIQVWQGPEFTRTRQLHATGKRNEIPFCKGCRIWDLDQIIEQQ